MKRYLRAIALVCLASSRAVTLADIILMLTFAFIAFYGIKNVKNFANSIQTGGTNDNEAPGMMGVRRKIQEDKKVPQMKSKDGMMMMDIGKIPPPPIEKISSQPAAVPSAAPSSVPSNSPSSTPSEIPSSTPSDVPTSAPSTAPSSAPASKSTGKGQMNDGGMSKNNKKMGLKGDGVMGA